MKVQRITQTDFPPRTFSLASVPWLTYVSALVAVLWLVCVAIRGAR